MPLVHPNFNPDFFSLGPIHATWYGLMYVVGFTLGYVLAKYRNRQFSIMSDEAVSDLLTYIMLGVILGGRIGYVLFYGWSFWMIDPLYIFKVWEGGMSFHGGLIGVIIACMIFSYRHKILFWKLADFIAPIIPLGLFFGRIGNFINGELWGKVTTQPWGMIFQNAPDMLPRHPSMLYEAILEGLVLFAILWLYSRQERYLGRVSGLFLLAYGCFRFFIEFFRVPDVQLGYLAFNWLTMGQILCLPMIILGGYLLLRKVKS